MIARCSRSRSSSESTSPLESLPAAGGGECGDGLAIGGGGGGGFFGGVSGSFLFGGAVVSGEHEASREEIAGLSSPGPALAKMSMGVRCTEDAGAGAASGDEGEGGETRVIASTLQV